jgi:hypothetical protein
VIRLSIGPLIWRLLDNMRSAASCRQRRQQQQLGAAARSADGAGSVGESVGDPCALKLALFSGHDTSVMPLLVALGHKIQTWPPFVAHVELELWAAAGSAAAGSGAAAAGGGGGGGAGAGGGPERRGAADAPQLLVAARFDGLPMVWPGGGGGGGAGADIAASTRHPHFISLAGFEQALRRVLQDKEGHERSCQAGR